MKRFWVMVSLVLALGACTKEDPWQPLSQQALQSRERGLNEKNATVYLSAVSLSYGGEATGFTRIEARVNALFGSIDEIRYTSSERSLYKEDDGRVRAVQRFAMDLKRDGKTKSLSGQEQLFLVQDPDGQYRIVDGL